MIFGWMEFLLFLFRLSPRKDFKTESSGLKLECVDLTGFSSQVGR